MNIDRQISLYDENLNSILGTNFFHRVVDFAVCWFLVGGVFKDLIYPYIYIYRY